MEKQLKHYTIKDLKTEITLITDRNKPSSIIGVLRALFMEMRKNPEILSEFMKSANTAYELSKQHKSKAVTIEDEDDFDFISRVIGQAPNGGREVS